MPKKRLLTINGRTQSLAAWAREAGVTPGCLHARLKLGIPLARAIEPGDGRSSAEVRFRMSEARRGNLNPQWKGGRTPEEKAEYAREWRQRNESYVRDREYQKRFGITLGDYERMLEAQGGVCLLCRKACVRGRLCVDHCHESKAIRGLLCRVCNLAIGIVRDDPEWMKRARDYLAGKK